MLTSLRLTKVLVVVLVLTTFGLASAQTTVGQKAQPQKQKAAEQYEEVDIDALSLYLETGIKSLGYNADRTLAGVDAIVTKFTIAAKPVELVTDKISIDQNDQHFATILTKQLGTIRLKLGQFGGGSVWLTPSQKNSVLALKTAQGAASPASATPFTDVDFVHVQRGTFQMGDATSKIAVTLTHGFWMQKTEVTQAQWQAVTGSNPSYHTDCPTCPVENVGYPDVQAFIAKINDLSPGKKYRLPTEAEWEYAARAGTTGDYGVPGPVTAGGWIVENSGGTTHPVGKLRPNAWGLYDMEGNVSEWVSGWASGERPKGPLTDPTGPASSCCRLYRGGSLLLFVQDRCSQDLLGHSVHGLRLRHHVLHLSGFGRQAKSVAGGQEHVVRPGTHDATSTQQI
jgi:hypothetical protein